MNKKVSKAYESLGVQIVFFDEDDIVRTSGGGKLDWGNWGDYEEERDDTYFGG